MGLILAKSIDLRPHANGLCRVGASRDCGRVRPQLRAAPFRTIRRRAPAALCDVWPSHGCRGIDVLSDGQLEILILQALPTRPSAAASAVRAMMAASARCRACVSRLKSHLLSPAWFHRRRAGARHGPCESERLAVPTQLRTTLSRPCVASLPRWNGPLSRSRPQRRGLQRRARECVPRLSFGTVVDLHTGIGAGFYVGPGDGAMKGNMGMAKRHTLAARRTRACHCPAAVLHRKLWPQSARRAYELVHMDGNTLVRE
jgi:hypothetical protein